MTNRFDIHYGRQGGRIVPFNQPVTEPVTCTACGQPITTGIGTIHATCTPPDPQDTLFT